MTTSASASARLYLLIWGYLAALMFLSVVLSGLPIPRSTVVLIVLGLSTVKALLVALYYMHLKFDRRWLAFVATFPLVLIALAAGVVLSSHLVKL